MTLKRNIAQRLTDAAQTIAAVRERAARQLTAELTFIAEAGRSQGNYASSEEWATSRNTLLRELLNRIGRDVDKEAEEDIRSGLRLLRPHAVVGSRKARFGSANDGGYVMVDDFHGIDTAFSFGIDTDAEWDLAVANRGLTVYHFDYTVSSPPFTHPHLIFAQKRVSTEAGPDDVNLQSLLSGMTKESRIRTLS